MGGDDRSLLSGRRWPEQASGAKQGGWSGRWSERQQSLPLSLSLPLFGMRVAKGLERRREQASAASVARGGREGGGWSRRWSGRQQSLLLLSLFLPLFGMRVAKGAERPTSRAGRATAGLFPFLACRRRAQRRVCLTSLIVNTRNLYP